MGVGVIRDQTLKLRKLNSRGVSHTLGSGKTYSKSGCDTEGDKSPGRLTRNQRTWVYVIVRSGCGEGTYPVCMCFIRTVFMFMFCLLSRRNRELKRRNEIVSVLWRTKIWNLRMSNPFTHWGFNERNHFFPRPGKKKTSCHKIKWSQIFALVRWGWTLDVPQIHRVDVQTY